MASKESLVLQRVCYEQPEVALALGVKNVRQAVLVYLFFGNDWQWFKGNPVKKTDVGVGGNLRVFQKSAWVSPLKSSGEESLAGFLENNFAAKTYFSALEVALSMARRSRGEAEEIMKRAAEKMYPEYVSRVEGYFKTAKIQVSLPSGIECQKIVFNMETSLLATIPKDLGPEWVLLVSEAMGIPKKIVDKFGAKTPVETKEAKKWIDKLARSLKRNGVLA
jgi:hypothetical protein